MDQIEKIVSRIKYFFSDSDSTPTASVFDEVTTLLINEGYPVDLEATSVTRSEAPNTIVVICIDGERSYVKMAGDGDIDIYDYYGPDCDTELISETEALTNWDDDPDKATREDLLPLRFIVRDGVKYYEEEDVYAVESRKGQAREARYEQQRQVSISLPNEFLLLCEQYDLTPEDALRGFVADVCGIVSYVANPRADGYCSNGSDERDMAEAYWKRTWWRPQVEERHGIPVHSRAVRA